jgi:hypothetical protein
VNVLDEQTKQKLQAAREAAPTQAEAKAKAAVKSAAVSAAASAPALARVMPDPRPKDCPDFASHAAEAGGRIIAYDSLPWSGGLGGSVKGREHLWIAIIARKHRPVFRQQLRQGDSPILCEAPASEENGGFVGASRKAAGFFRGRLGDPPEDANAVIEPVFVVFGWLEV